MSTNIDITTQAFGGYRKDEVQRAFNDYQFKVQEARAESEERAREAAILRTVGEEKDRTISGLRAKLDGLLLNPNDPDNLSEQSRAILDKARREAADIRDRALEEARHTLDQAHEAIDARRDELARREEDSRAQLDELRAKLEADTQKKLNEVNAWRHAAEEDIENRRRRSLDEISRQEHEANLRIDTRTAEEQNKIQEWREDSLAAVDAAKADLTERHQESARLLEVARVRVEQEVLSVVARMKANKNEADSSLERIESVLGSLGTPESAVPLPLPVAETADPDTLGTHDTKGSPE